MRKPGRRIGAISTAERFPGVALERTAAAVGYAALLMTSPTSAAVDFRVTRVLWAATLVECVVLTVSGFGLMFLPDALVPLWPWPLSHVRRDRDRRRGAPDRTTTQLTDTARPCLRCPG